MSTKKCSNRNWRTSFRLILPLTALKIRRQQPACGFLSCHQQNLLENPHTIPIGTVSKAIPHKDCRADAQSAFSSDCPELRRNTGVFQGVLGKNDGKDASVCAAKRAVRSLRGVALILIPFKTVGLVFWVQPFLNYGFYP